MPFSILFERRAKQRESERLRVIEEVKRAAAALRARFAYDELLMFGSLTSGKFDRHSDIDLKAYEDLDESLRRRIDGEGIRLG